VFSVDLDFSVAAEIVLVQKKMLSVVTDLRHVANIMCGINNWCYYYGHAGLVKPATSCSFSVTWCLGILACVDISPWPCT